MEKKDLEKILNYLPVIKTLCDNYGWDGKHGWPVTQEGIAEVRKFFDYLQNHIDIKSIPEPYEIMGSPLGGVSIVWDTEIDPVKVTYDTFEVMLTGEDVITYKGDIESLGVKLRGGEDLQPALNPDIIEYIRFFKRKEDEQNESRQVQKPATSKSTANK